MAISLDSVTNAIDSATTSVGSAVTSLIDSGPASALSNIADSVSGALSSLGSMFTALPGVKLPLKNPLFAYASYDYVLGIACLTDNDLNHPDKSYIAGKRLPLVAKSANADPSNRVATPYGKFDFFIDDVDLASIIGHEKGHNTNVTNISFKVTEPYSMGLFFMSLETVARKCGHKNWRMAPFLLTIEFRGNKETGTMSKIPGTSRYIPFKFADMSMTCNEKGSVYTCTALPYNQQALSDTNSKMKSDHTVKGATIQEILQTGEQSLQAVINRRLKDMGPSKLKLVEVPDEVLILFPNNTASSAQNNQPPTDAGATTKTEASVTATTVFKSLGVARNANDQLAQAATDCNAIGKSRLGFDEKRKGDPGSGNELKAYNAKGSIINRGDATLKIDPKITEMKFNQDSDIPNAINQVIMQSDFVPATLDASALTKEGMRKWWRIDVQTYNISEENPSTGTKAKLIVYRIVPYEAHAGALTSPNAKPPGYEELKKQAVKVYEYIYTGHNVDVLKFNITYQNNFIKVMAADGLVKSQDVKQAAKDGGADNNQTAKAPLAPGNLPEEGTIPTIVKYVATKTGSDGKGGGGSERQETRVARLFHDALTTGNDMINLDLEIIGDPYWIAQSGMGNYTAKSTQYKNLNSDGSVNYQNGEVDCLVKFRTPIDINQTTGLYTFGGTSKSAPVEKFSGLYRVTNVRSSFSKGVFRQTLTGMRRPMQESKKPANPSQVLNTTNNNKDVTPD